MIATMQDPPTHVVVSVELAMFFLSGDVEMVGGALRWGILHVGQRKAVRELAEDGGEILIAGSIKRKGKKGNVDAATRAKEIHDLVPEPTRRRTTIAVTETKEGTRIVSSSERSLRPSQRAALHQGEIEGIGLGHAETTGLATARELGLTPTGTAASRPTCGNCASSLKAEGVQTLSPLR
ncbi:hypothetical protein G6O69_22485 [Pseudenhygromyxa sp. WMMC2535]|uniref:hypothetical protein n=1 Tax=Pseudenhygromyxa sp. WMMC2535 TaxID=2712867 RepID=UPI001594FE21|nr:hypothetical protein [Pseudenhygromyxa sp. WMMC2535]NVB40623.1 hypothetical protein [Pseudenhygromyxa sp. WMMC2535]